MELLLYVGITASTFVLMEAVAWLSHKYLMHGIFWFFHEDHHQHNSNIEPFEWNDFFFLLFALPGIVLLAIGVKEFSIPFWIGLGITVYGFAYFLLLSVIFAVVIISQFYIEC